MLLSTSKLAVCKASCASIHAAARGSTIACRLVSPAGRQLLSRPTMPGQVPTRFFGPQPRPTSSARAFRNLWPGESGRNQEVQELTAKLLEAEKAKVEAEKAQVEAEKAKVEAEKAKIEAEKAKVEAEKAAEAANKEAEEVGRQRRKNWWIIFGLILLSLCLFIVTIKCF